MFDLKIINGIIIDGSGKPRFKADIGIKHDKIETLGNLKDAESKVTIDAMDKIVCPGFIDMHSHSDLSIIYDKYNSARIYNGVTTDVIGNCGIGLAPIMPENKELLIDYLGTRLVGSLPVNIQLHWHTFKEYLDYIMNNNLTVNIAPLVAQGTVRIAEMGFSKQRANSIQIKNMQDMVDQSMAEGGLGLSSGLIYLPGLYTNTDELVELTKVLKPYNGFYATHMRNESDLIFTALDEAIDIARRANVPLHISHLKLKGPKVRGMAEKLLNKIEEAEDQGMDISFDVYPYQSGMTSLTTLIPPWAFEGGIHKLITRLKDGNIRKRIKNDCLNGVADWHNYADDIDDWDDITIATVVNEHNKRYEGKTIKKIAGQQNKEIYDAIFDLLIEENGRIQIVTRVMNEDDVVEIIKHRKAMYVSDSMGLSKDGPISLGKPHPRAFGSQGRILGKYVRKMKLLSLEEAIKKMTSMPAQRLNLDKRGLLRRGHYADIVVFDSKTIEDKATYQEPKQYTVGMETVVINGKLVLEAGKHCTFDAGRILGRK